MEEQPLSALIDQYLMGTISTQDKATLEHLMATDTSVAGQVRDSQQAFKAIQLQRNRQWKDRLRELDKKDLRQQGFLTNRIGRLLFITAVLLLCLCMASVYYSPSAIARRNFVNYVAPITGTSGAQESIAAWDKANNAFMQKEYEMAIQRYVALSDEVAPSDAFVARWNILLSQLALDGPTPNWKMALEAFAREAPEPLSTRAYKLSSFYNSGFNKMFFIHLQDNLSSIKPRLI